MSNKKTVKLSECQINLATIYQTDSVVLKREVKAELVQGINEVLIAGSFGLAKKDSFRCTGTANGTILEVAFINKTVPATSDEAAVATIQQKLNEVGLKIGEKEQELSRNDKVSNTIEAYKEQAFSSLKHKAEKGADDVLGPSSLAALENFLGFYGSHLTACDSTKNKVSQELTSLREERSKLQEELKKAKNPQPEHVVGVNVVLDVPAAGPSSFFLSYLSRGASWTPSYDVRASMSDGTPSCDLTYYGSVIQHTGEDWTDVKLCLSTAEPSISGVPPTFKSPLQLKFQRPGYNPYGNTTFAKKSLNVNVAHDRRYSVDLSDEVDDLSIGAARGGGGGWNFMQQAPMNDGAGAGVSVGAPEAGPSGSSGEPQAVTSSQFLIPRPCSIPSDDCAHKVTITSMALDSTFSYFAVPRLAPNAAYLRVKAKNSSLYFILPGPASVYFGNSFVSTSALNAVSPGEQFEVFLGIDPKIRVDNKPTKRLQETQGLIFTSNKINVHRSTVIKNCKTVAIELTIEDQNPVSSDARIKATVVEPAMRAGDRSKDIKLFAPVALPTIASPAAPSQAAAQSQAASAPSLPVDATVSYRDKDEIYVWTMHLQPGQEVEIPFSFTVEWPKNTKLAENFL